MRLLTPQFETQMGALGALSVLRLLTPIDEIIDQEHPDRCGSGYSVGTIEQRKYWDLTLRGIHERRHTPRDGDVDTFDDLRTTLREHGLPIPSRRSFAERLTAYVKEQVNKDAYSIQYVHIDDVPTDVLLRKVQPAQGSYHVPNLEMNELARRYFFYKGNGNTNAAEAIRKGVLPVVRQDSLQFSSKVAFDFFIECLTIESVVPEADGISVSERSEILRTLVRDGLIKKKGKPDARVIPMLVRLAEENCALFDFTHMPIIGLLLEKFPTFLDTPEHDILSCFLGKPDLLVGIYFGFYEPKNGQLKVSQKTIDLFATHLSLFRITEERIIEAMSQVACSENIQRSWNAYLLLQNIFSEKKGLFLQQQRDRFLLENHFEPEDLQRLSLPMLIEAYLDTKRVIQPVETATQVALILKNEIERRITADARSLTGFFDVRTESVAFNGLMERCAQIQSLATCETTLG